MVRKSSFKFCGGLIGPTSVSDKLTFFPGRPCLGSKSLSMISSSSFSSCKVTKKGGWSLFLSR
jgi:hypothetical protein